MRRTGADLDSHRCGGERRTELRRDTLSFRLKRVSVTLAEIAETNRGYDQWAKEQSAIAQKLIWYSKKP